MGSMKDLFGDTPYEPPPPPPPGTLEDEFKLFHAKNPRVYELVDQFAKRAISRGRRKFAIATIWELIRWHINIEADDENFKMPNNHRAYYARLWMRNNPQYPGFFETAELRSVRPVKVDRYGRAVDDEDGIYDDDEPV